MKIVVTGGRGFTDRGFVFATLTALHIERPITLLVEGGQRTRDPETQKLIGGADYFAALWAVESDVDLITENADWVEFGSRAGPIRNARMLREHNPAIVVAFPGGKGTADCVRKARNMNIQVKEFAPA